MKFFDQAGHGRTNLRIGRAFLFVTGISTVWIVALGHGYSAIPPPKPNGEAVFNKRCILCHGTGGRAPQVEMLRKLPASEIYRTLTVGAMQTQAAPLSDAEKHAVADYLGSGQNKAQLRADLNPCTPPEAAALQPVRWQGWSTDPDNTRAQTSSAAGLTAQDVPRLELKWAFVFPGANTAANQPTVAGDRLYIGSWDGTIFALNAQSGCSYWTFKADTGVRTAVVIASGVGLFGDFKANVYAVDLTTGKLRWKTKVEDHLEARITGTPVVWQDRVYVPVSSLEEGTAADPKYECCTFRGSVVALSIADGTQVWKSYTIDEVPHRIDTNKAGTAEFGPAGAAVWSAPTVDAKRHLLYAADGNSYSSPETPTAEAVLAFDLDSGKRRWAKQLNLNDIWNAACMKGQDATNCPAKQGPDYDFGASPALVTLADGRDLLLAGQKSGILYALNPDSGDVVWKVRLGQGGSFGGIQWGIATDGRLAYAPISDRDVTSFEADGSISAVDLKSGERLWRTSNPADGCKGHTELCSIAQAAAATVMPGVVFSGSFDGHLRAYDTETGKIVWDYDSDRSFQGINRLEGHGGSISAAGPTIANGFVYQTSGYASFGLGMPGNVLLAFGPAGQTADHAGKGTHPATN